MKAKHIMLVLGMTMILTFTGCGSSKPVVEVTPTPAAAASDGSTGDSGYSDENGDNSSYDDTGEGDYDGE